MRLKSYIFGLMAMLAMGICSQMPLQAAKASAKKEKQKQSSSSSSNSHKRHNKAKKCCKKTIELLEQVDQTTMQDLIVDQNILGLTSQINQTTRQDLATDLEILDKVEQIIDCTCKCQLIMPQDFADSDGNLTQTYLITTPYSGP